MGRIERFESERGPSFLFHSSVVLLNNVVEIFALPDFYPRTALRVVSLDGCCITTALINIDFIEDTIVANALPQETQSRPGISFGG